MLLFILAATSLEACRGWGIEGGWWYPLQNSYKPYQGHIDFAVSEIFWNRQSGSSILYFASFDNKVKGGVKNYLRALQVYLPDNGVDF